MGPYISSTVYNTATHRAVKKKNRPPPLLTIVPQISSRTVFPSLYYNLIVSYSLRHQLYVIDSCVQQYIPLIGRRSILIPIGYVNLIRPPSPIGKPSFLATVFPSYSCNVPPDVYVLMSKSWIIQIRARVCIQFCEKYLYIKKKKRAGILPWYIPKTRVGSRCWQEGVILHGRDNIKVGGADAPRLAGEE